MIYWDLLLKSDDPATTLRQLYEVSSSLQALADHLGVSKNTLVATLKDFHIPIRRRGGGHPSVRRELIPDNAAELTAKELAVRTGYTAKYCEKLLTNLRKEKEHVDS